MCQSIRASIEVKYKKGNKLLFTKESECLQELIHLVEMQNHRTLVMWALECGDKALFQFEQYYPNEKRPRRALELCEAWARGFIKMPEAKKAILASHAVAKEIDNRQFIAIAHAIGQAGATVHVKTHALGVVFYELTSIVYQKGLDSCEVAVRNQIDIYYDRLLYWQKNIDTLDVSWAEFLSRDIHLNQEKERV